MLHAQCNQDDRLITARERLALAATLCVLGLAMLASGCQTGIVGETAHGVSASPPSTDASEVYAAQDEIIRAMRMMYPSVEATVIWKPCGEENSYYYPDRRRIALCTEMSAHPGAAIFFAAHEFGHAVTSQLADLLDEQAADEVGALAMIDADLRAELLEAAIYHAKERPQGHTPGDSHPSNGYRAWELACLEDGSEETPSAPECRDLYRGLHERWERRLHDDVEPTDDLDALFLQLAPAR